MTRQEFLPAYNRLCVALREPADETGVQVTTYFDALADLPVLAVSEGAAVLMREPGRRFFPTTAEWREVASRVHTDQLRKALPAGREEPWHHLCAQCADTSWVTSLCPGDVSCGRHKAHAGHHYVRRCPCWPDNPTTQRNMRFGHAL